MGLFHCPIGAPFYDDESCINCGLCIAKTKEEMIEASRKMQEHLRCQKIKQVSTRRIAVAGKGGVGKSTLVALIAGAIRDKGYKVLVMDMDESNPGLRRLFGVKKELKPLISIGGSGEQGIDSGKGKFTIDDIPTENIFRDGNLRFVIAGKIEEPFQGCSCEMADRARDFVERLVLEDKEIVIMDMEAGIESFGRGVERAVDTLLLIVEPSFESMALAQKINYMAEGMGIPKVRVILNKVSSETVEGQMKERLNSEKIMTIGTIYFDSQVNESGFSGEPLKQTSSRTKNEITRIVDSLLETVR